MKHTIHCLHCNAILGVFDLKKLKRLVMTCPECGGHNEIDYDPTDYVYKERGARA